MYVVWSAGMDKFAQEIILQHTPAHMHADFGATTAEDARNLRKQDTEHCVDSWSSVPAAHGGVQSRFNHFYGSMVFSLMQLAAADSKWRKVPEQNGGGAHKRAVLAPVVVSAMFRTGLLGAVSMEQVNQLYTLTCLESLFNGYVVKFITLGAHVHATARANAQQHVICAAYVLANAKANTVMCVRSVA